MPFSKYVADPVHVEAMRLAFYRVCEKLQLGPVADPLTELLVTKIVALVKAGEVDPDRLCSRVLLELGVPEPPPAE
jgi:hypothetical protein